MKDGQTAQLGQSLTLNVSGSLLTGSLGATRNNQPVVIRGKVAQHAIKDGHYLAGVISFSSSSKGPNGATWVTTYSGTVSQNSIVGTFQTERDGRTVRTAQKWTATRNGDIKMPSGDNNASPSITPPTVADFENSIDQALLDKIKQAAATNPPPEIPEEARAHFIKAGVLLKEAKDQSDYELAANEYLAARSVAPWWPAVYYNLAMVREAEKQYDNAVNDLKLYLASNPDDARAAQDKLYQIQAKRDLAAKHAVDERQTAETKTQQAGAAAKERMKHILAGRWMVENARRGMERTLTVSGSNGTYTGKNGVEGRIQGDGAYQLWAMESFSAYDQSVTFRIRERSMTDDGRQYAWSTEDYNLKVSDDGTKLVGSCHNEGRGMARHDEPIIFLKAQ